MISDIRFRVDAPFRRRRHNHFRDPVRARRRHHGNVDRVEFFIDGQHEHTETGPGSWFSWFWSLSEADNGSRALSMTALRPVRQPDDPDIERDSGRRRASGPGGNPVRRLGGRRRPRRRSHGPDTTRPGRAMWPGIASTRKTQAYLECRRPRSESRGLRRAFHRLPEQPGARHSLLDSGRGRRRGRTTRTPRSSRSRERPSISSLPKIFPPWPSNASKTAWSSRGTTARTAPGTWPDTTSISTDRTRPKFCPRRRTASSGLSFPPAESYPVKIAAFSTTTATKAPAGPRPAPPCWTTRPTSRQSPPTKPSLSSGVPYLPSDLVKHYAVYVSLAEFCHCGRHGTGPDDRRENLRDDRRARANGETYWFAVTARQHCKRGTKTGRRRVRHTAGRYPGAGNRRGRHRRRLRDPAGPCRVQKPRPYPRSPAIRPESAAVEFLLDGVLSRDGTSPARPGRLPLGRRGACRGQGPTSWP